MESLILSSSFNTHFYSIYMLLTVNLTHWIRLTLAALKDLILVHTVQLKPMRKAHSSGKMVSSGIGDVVITLEHSEKKTAEEVDDES